MTDPTARGRDRSLARLAALVSCGLLLFNTGSRRSEGDLLKLRTPRRYWEDLSVAITRYAAEPTPAAEPPSAIDSSEGYDLKHSYARFIARTVRSENVRPWQFWRTIALKPFLERERLDLRPSDDPGRAMLLSFGFRVLGGIAPFLPLWLGALACLPVLAWACWELAESGHAPAGFVFAVAFASSPFVVEVLSLPYSAVGFYLLGILVLVPLSVYALLGRGDPRGLLVRALAAGGLFALCALCRSGALLLLGGYVLALGLWALRRPADGPGEGRASPRAAATLLAAVAVLLAPFVVWRQPRHHEAWLGIWEGLGDFDRTKGHSFLDSVGHEALRREGLVLPEGPNSTPESEAIFRRLVTHDILSDPLWYLGILGHRIRATVLQEKLWPWGPRDGLSVAPSQSQNEGVTDVYYRLATPVDFVGVGAHEAELPVSLLVLPAFAILALWVAGRWIPALGNRRFDLGQRLNVLLCVAVAALGLPVLVTTASGPETESFALVHFLAWGFLAEEAWRWAASKAGPGPSRGTPGS